MCVFACLLLRVVGLHWETEGRPFLQKIMVIALSFLRSMESLGFQFHLVVETMLLEKSGTPQSEGFLGCSPAPFG